MYKILLILFMSCPFVLFSQQKEKRYFDEKNQPIGARKFWSDQDAFGKLHLNYETDSADIFVKVNRENSGVLDRQSLQLIRQDLEEAARVNIDSTHILVIDYYPGMDEFNSGEIVDPKTVRQLYRRHLKNLYSLAPLDQFSVYSDSTGLAKYHGIVEWYPDIHDRLKHTFFKLHYPGGSVVVIDPSGRYYSYYGEYDRQQVYYFVHALYNRAQGVLHPDSLRLLRSNLEASADLKIDPSRILVIDYYSGEKDCLKTCDCNGKFLKNYQQEYLKKLYTIAPVAQFNIYGKQEGLEGFKGVIWRPDFHNSVKNNFFANRNSCTGVVVIHPDGTYRISHGEYSKESVWNYVEELAKK
jgi:hypothetical protein